MLTNIQQKNSANMKKNSKKGLLTLSSPQSVKTKETLPQCADVVNVGLAQSSRAYLPATYFAIGQIIGRCQKRLTFGAVAETIFCVNRMSQSLKCHVIVLE